MRTSHGLLYFDGSSYFSVDAGIEEDKCNVWKEFGKQSFGPKVVVDNVIAIGPQCGVVDISVALWVFESL